MNLLATVAPVISMQWFVDLVNSPPHHVNTNLQQQYLKLHLRQQNS